VNPTLSERLTSLDFQAIIEGKEANLKLHPQVFQLFNRALYYLTYCIENSVWLDLQYCISGFKLFTSRIDNY
jgi:hypothetical protein